MKETLDFIVIGAQKAGTTSLFEYLRRHPEIYLPAGKEAPFFSHDEVVRQGWDKYMSRYFAAADPAVKWGTVTPQYMVGGLWQALRPTMSGERCDERTVPLRMRDRLPRVRLVAILRDPAARARSQHRMAVMNQLETRSFDQAIDDLLEPRTLADARREPRETTGYVVWGEYGRILGGYYDVFPREQILVLYTSELERDPAELLRRAHRFLGVDADFVPDNLGTRYRTGAGRRRFSVFGIDEPLNPWTVQRVLARQAVARRLWHALPARQRRQLDRIFARIAYEVDVRNRAHGPIASAAQNGSTLERLRAHYADDRRQLASLTGAEPPW